MTDLLTTKEQRQDIGDITSRSIETHGRMVMRPDTIVALISDIDTQSARITALEAENASLRAATKESKE